MYLGTNPRMMVAGLVMALASIHSIWQGNFKLGVVFASFAISNLVLSTIR